MNNSDDINLDMDDINALHKHLDTYKLLNDMGHNFYPLRNAVMENIKDLQAKIMGVPRDDRPQVVTPGAGPASSLLVDQETGVGTRIPDPQLTQARNDKVPVERAAGPDVAVNDDFRGVPNPEVVLGESGEFGDRPEPLGLNRRV